MPSDEDKKIKEAAENFFGDGKNPAEVAGNLPVEDQTAEVKPVDNAGSVAAGTSELVKQTVAPDGQSKEQLKGKICSQCGAENHIDDVFCGNCGSTFDVTAAPADGRSEKQPEGKICSICGISNPLDVAYCGNCGIDFDDKKKGDGGGLSEEEINALLGLKTCPGCGGMVSLDEAVCSACGFSFDDNKGVEDGLPQKQIDARRSLRKAELDESMKQLRAALDQWLILAQAVRADDNTTSIIAAVARVKDKIRDFINQNKKEVKENDPFLLGLLYKYLKEIPEGYEREDVMVLLGAISEVLNEPDFKELDMSDLVTTILESTKQPSADEKKPDVSAAAVEKKEQWIREDVIAWAKEQVGEDEKWVDETFDFSEGGWIATKGDLILHGNQITILPPNLCRVRGGLYLIDTKIAVLLDDMGVDDNLDISNTPIVVLPNNLYVGKNLDISGTKIAALPDSLGVGGDVYTKNAELIVPEGTVVKGKFYLWNKEKEEYEEWHSVRVPNAEPSPQPDTGAGKQPAGDGGKPAAAAAEGVKEQWTREDVILWARMKVGRDKEWAEDTFDFSTPGKIVVHGDLDLSDIPIVSLPENLLVEGSLIIAHTKIVDLPANLQIGGDFRLGFTEIAFLPVDLRVGGNLDIFDTKIAILPANLQVGGDLKTNNAELIVPKGVIVKSKFYLWNNRAAGYEEWKPVMVPSTGPASQPDTGPIPAEAAVEAAKKPWTKEDVVKWACEQLSPEYYNEKWVDKNFDFGTPGKIEARYSLGFFGASKVTFLPDDLRVVEGCLILSHTKIATLPDNLYIGEDLDLQNTPITVLSANLRVEKDLNIIGTQIKYLPNDLQVGGNLKTDNAKLVIPEGVVKGKFYLWNNRAAGYEEWKPVMVPSTGPASQPDTGAIPVEANPAVISPEEPQDPVEQGGLSQREIEAMLGIELDSAEREILRAGMRPTMQVLAEYLNSHNACKGEVELKNVYVEEIILSEYFDLKTTEAVNFLLLTGTEWDIPRGGGYMWLIFDSKIKQHIQEVVDEDDDINKELEELASSAMRSVADMWNKGMGMEVEIGHFMAEKLADNLEAAAKEKKWVLMGADLERKSDKQTFQVSFLVPMELAKEMERQEFRQGLKILDLNKTISESGRREERVDISTQRMITEIDVLKTQLGLVQKQLESAKQAEGGKMGVWQELALLHFAPYRKQAELIKIKMLREEKDKEKRKQLEEVNALDIFATKIFEPKRMNTHAAKIKKPIEEWKLNDVLVYIKSWTDFLKKQK